MRRLALNLLFSLPLAGTSIASTTGFTDIVVFGDSLSDNGNLFAQTGFPPPPYWEGRFSNGPVWVEQMANHLGFAASAISDHAVGGSDTQAVYEQQVLPYLASVGSADPGALYVYWAGANDLLNLMSDPSGDPAVVIGTAMQNTGAALTMLIGAGAHTILVANMPDLAEIPAVILLHDADLSAAARALSLAYNDALAQTLAAIASSTDVQFVAPDIFALTHVLTAGPSHGDFHVVGRPALSPDGSIAPNLHQYLFWDDEHPTTRAHSFIMGAALGELGILWGDVNGDGVLSGRDMSALTRAFGSSLPGSAADLNGDGTVDTRDVDLMHGILH